MIVTAGILAVGTVTWAFLGNPAVVSRSHFKTRFVDQFNSTTGLQRTTYIPNAR